MSRRLYIGGADACITATEVYARRDSNYAWVALITDLDPYWGLGRQFLMRTRSGDGFRWRVVGDGVYEWRYFLTKDGSASNGFFVVEGQSVREVNRSKIIDIIEPGLSARPLSPALETLIEQARRLTPSQIDKLLYLSVSRARDEAELIIAEDDARFAYYITFRHSQAVAFRVFHDAALALIACDRLTAEQFSLLYGPWATIMDEAG
ncbi:MAG: hypothetical protein ACYCU8_00295 [Ferrimicrobium acidiphilum]